MNHIARLTQERDAAQTTIRETRDALLEIILYLRSDKFRWPDQDYVFVSTDMLPKLNELHWSLCGK